MVIMTISIEDERAIESLLVRYAKAADQRDAAMLATCFTEDVQADYGPPIGRFDAREALVSHLVAMLVPCGPTLHYVGNFTFTADGEGVRSHCYTHAVVYLPGNDQPIRPAGICEDRLRRTDDGWRIFSRIYTPIA